VEILRRQGQKCAKEGLPLQEESVFELYDESRVEGAYHNTVYLELNIEHDTNEQQPLNLVFSQKNMLK
jgi:hypothetical protein